MKVKIVNPVNARMVGCVMEPNVYVPDISKVNFAMSVNVKMEDHSTVKTARVQKIIMELSVKNQNVSMEEEFLKELVIISAIAPKTMMVLFVRIVNAKMAELVLLMDVTVHHLLKETFVNNRNVKVEKESTLEIQENVYVLANFLVSFVKISILRTQSFLVKKNDCMINILNNEINFRQNLRRGK
jgi:hypothetical protein